MQLIWETNCDTNKTKYFPIRQLDFLQTIYWFNSESASPKMRLLF